jgi:hypothetical protein
VDKVGILCAKDRQILHDFSKRCMEGLQGRSFVTMPLPFLRTYMNANVAKEVDKDRLIIEYAAGRFREGKACCDYDIESLFEMTKKVDKAFLRKVLVPSLSITVRYEDIEAVRKARIDCIARCVHELLASWEDEKPLEDAVRTAYTGQAFRETMTEVLHLYNRETKKLSSSIRLFGPLQMAADAFAETLYRTMEEVTESMADSFTQQIYGKRARA